MRPRLAWREDMTAVTLGIWILMGMHLDAASHSRLGGSDSFFNPWHALLYSGVAASVLWVARIVYRAPRGGTAVTSAIPHGYGLGIVGLALFIVGGLVDMVWHTYVGRERGIEVLLSPPHNLILLGGILIVSSPFRAAWSKEGDAPSLKAFLPALLSLVLSVSVIAFAFLYAYALFYDHLRMEMYLTVLLREALLPSTAAAGLYQEMIVRRVVGTMIFSTILVFAPILLMLRRWRLPWGSLTIYLTITVGSLSVPMALATGLLADGLHHLLRPSPQRMASLRLFAAVLPLPLWTVFAIVGLTQTDLPIAPTIWAAAVIWMMIGGLGLSYIVLPPPFPQEAAASL